MRNVVFNSLGFICLLLAVIGIVLPVLPTTPFVLLASACFMRGSAKFRSWLHNHSVFGPILDNWHKSRAVSRSVKRRGVILITVSFALSIWIVSVDWLKILLLLTYLVLICWFIRLPTLEFVAHKRENH
ncbi:YbaN family protein [Vibrio marisflavi]|uniref:Inner membrane protein n=1 Tax=Vibrio marisflavi CECT 7928 TaxID=634439 RepID=A0ABM9A650_9VIBR|nr:YbaN family protein [Vibrio marisflavi]CAH0540741.1 Inner membrane protein YbaN [Vibrio marisflavi CECT 7928]